jgi:predicted dehydrogenase
MNQEKAIIGFIGAGGIARSHAFAINSLRYYYNDYPAIELAAVCSATVESRLLFAKRFGFNKSPDLDNFTSDNRINSVYILGPNKVHYEHLKTVIEMASLKRVYIEKPVCSNPDEEKAISALILKHPQIKIQVGFQFLFTPAVREALAFWKSGKLGKPLHFDFKYYHGDYLQKEYRDKRITRLTPAPDGGAMADLGCHVISLLIAFLGNQVHITSALQSGHFEDVSEKSDLFSLITLYDNASGAAGTLSASRISSGTGDQLSLELFAENGSLRYSSQSADYFEFYIEKSGLWSRQVVGSNYLPVSSFPSGHVPPGWLRSMIHAHYVFLTCNDQGSFVPDIEHGLAVQRLVTQTAEYLKEFRVMTSSDRFNAKSKL